MNKLRTLLFCVLCFTLSASFLHSGFVVKATLTLTYPANAVWIANGGWVSMNGFILLTNLSKVVNDLKNNYIQYAFVFTGSWNANTNNISYAMTDALLTSTINALHAVNVKVIAWVEDGGGGTMDIRAANRQNLISSVLACMTKGFDGYNDDIESWVGGSQQDQIDWVNSLTAPLHAVGKLNMPDIGFDWQQNVNEYLYVDYIVSMFYSSRSTLEDAQAPYFWQEEFGEFQGHTAHAASPIILGIMNFPGNTYPLSWQLAQVSTYISQYGAPQLAGFSFWLYEYMGTNPDDWVQWNLWISEQSTDDGGGTPQPRPFPVGYITLAAGVAFMIAVLVVGRRKKKT